MWVYSSNFLLILLSITAFISPFYLWFWYVHRPKVNTFKDFNTSLEYFFSSNQGNYLIFSWAALEAVIWFVIPEFLLILVIFMRIHKKRQMLMYDIYGTITGTLLAFIISFSPSALIKLPFIQTKMITQVGDWFSSLGVWGLLHQPFSGVPYKVFTNLASHYHIAMIEFLIVAIIVRISRYVVFYGIALAAFPKLHKYVYKNYLYLYVGTILIFSVLLYKAYMSFA